MNNDIFVVNSIEKAISFLNDRILETGRTLNSIALESGNLISTFSRISRYGEKTKLNNFLKFANAIGYTIGLVHTKNSNLFFPDVLGNEVSTESLIKYLTAFRNMRETFISLTNISSQTGISHTTFMRMEKGETIPRFDVFLEYVKALDFQVVLCPIKTKNKQR